MRAACGAVGLAVTLVAAVAPAREQTADEVPRDRVYPALRQGGRFPVRGAPSGWAGGLEAYGGLDVQGTAGSSRAHVLGGGLVRGRYDYVQVGLQAEQSDRPGEERMAVGGFAGTLLPFAGWVDLDATVGLLARRYANPDPRFGPGGYELRSLTLAWRLGISDRAGEDLVGARIGGGLTGGVDFERHVAPWTYETTSSSGQIVSRSGTTAVGGISLGLVVSVGVEIGGR